MERQNELDWEASKYGLDKVLNNAKKPCRETGEFTTFGEAELPRDAFEEFEADTGQPSHLVGFLRLTSGFIGAYVQQDATQEQDDASILRQLTSNASTIVRRIKTCQ
jgi:hypothetical protein